jgi:hypothetical protein
VVRALVKHAQRISDSTWDTSRGGETDPADWGTAKANEYVRELMHCAEQLFIVSAILKRAFPAPFDIDEQSLSFLRWLGVPVTDLSKLADLSRPTIYSHLDQLRKTLQETGIPLNTEEGIAFLKGETGPRPSSKD